MSKRIHTEFVETATEISPALAAAIETIGPIRLQRRDDQPLVNVLFRSIAGQQLSTASARSIWNRVLANAGDRSLLEFMSTTDPDQIRRCGLSAAKVKSIKAIIDADANGLLDQDTLARLNHADRSGRLTTIWGVGPWTADMLGIFYFGDADVWPEGDLAVRKTLQKLTSRRRKTIKTAARFAPHRSYLALYLWRITDTSGIAAAGSRATP